MTEKEYELIIEFGMWLTTRDKTIKVGASETVYDMNDAITEFVTMKGIPQPKRNPFADYEPPPHIR